MQYILENYEAIGTKWWIEILSSNTIKNDELVIRNLREDITSLIRSFENSYSRFIDTSYICRLNEHKHIAKPPRDLIEMIEWGEKLRVDTSNRFNLGVGKTLENMGYDQQYSFESKTELQNQIQNTFSVFKKIDSKEVVIFDDARIDLGGIGKGWLIDMIADLLNRSDIGPYLINGGGDIFVRSEGRVSLKLENPFENQSFIGEINLKNKSLGSSSPKLRQWRDKKTGKILHHLVNMKNKKNIHDVVAVFTTGTTARVADSLSTCIFISPYEIAQKLSSKYQVEFAIIYSNGEYKLSSGFEGEFFI